MDWCPLLPFYGLAHEIVKFAISDRSIQVLCIARQKKRGSSGQRVKVYSKTSLIRSELHNTVPRHATLVVSCCLSDTPCMFAWCLVSVLLPRFQKAAKNSISE